MNPGETIQHPTDPRPGSLLRIPSEEELQNRLDKLLERSNSR